MKTNKEVIMSYILKELNELTRIQTDLELMNDDVCPLAKLALADRIASMKDKTETLGTYSELFLWS